MIAIIVPAFNEQKILEKNILQINKEASKLFGREYKLVISDNASEDDTGVIGKKLAKKNARIFYHYTSEKGKGNAIIAASKAFKADWYISMDCDLPVNPTSLKKLMQYFRKDCDLIIGDRHHGSARLEATKLRKFISRGYVFFAKFMLGLWKVNDFQTGFKAWNSKITEKVIPLCREGGWFFDTELIYFASKQGFKLCFVPVRYKIESVSRRSKVPIVKEVFRFAQKCLLLRVSRRNH